MKKDIWIGKKGFRYVYYTFRDSQYYSYSIISIICIACFLLIFYVIIPELSNWFSIRDEVEATQQKISVLQQNISFINNLDKNQLDTQLQTASNALPPDKDFGMMLQSLSRAAAASGVSLNDFSFQVGSLQLNTSSAKTEPAVRTVPQIGTPLGTPQTNGLSTIQITVVAGGDITRIENFMKDLENSLPLAEVTNINGSGTNVSITIEFYEKPFPTITFTGETPLAPLSQDNQTLLQSLSKLDTTQSKNTSTVISSGSATTIPLF
jgi:hypothetical protein